MAVKNEKHVIDKTKALRMCVSLKHALQEQMVPKCIADNMVCIIDVWCRIGHRDNSALLFYLCGPVCSHLCEWCYINSLRQCCTLKHSDACHTSAMSDSWHMSKRPLFGRTMCRNKAYLLCNHHETYITVFPFNISSWKISQKWTMCRLQLSKPGISETNTTSKNVHCVRQICNIHKLVGVLIFGWSTQIIMDSVYDRYCHLYAPVALFW